MNVPVICLLLFCLVSIPLSDHSQKWQPIGSVQAMQSADHASISVAPDFGRFRHFKFRVSKRALKLVKVVVTYNTGRPDNIETYEKIPKDGESRTISLMWVEDRPVKMIRFWFVLDDSDSGNAIVSVFTRW